ncbi:hypothetical protein ACS0TY_029027 [Phlomoides rotata]
MASVAMAVEEKHGSPTNDEILLKSRTMDKDVQSKDQFNTGDDSTLKVRKPYTITKQRERWTEEEHTKFLEALKLYGRAWKKIEEHVGTKTAVQIRSHAQKFFSKIVRESDDGDASDAKAIEIPPPRPKRKPVHPYPRKLVSPAKTGISMPEKLTRSVSQDSSILEHENQSPVSVLSANSSDASVRADSCAPNGSLSPVSSTLAPDASIHGSKAHNLIPDDSISQLGNEDENPNPIPLKPELLCQTDDLVQEDQSPVQCLKLFGKTLLVKDSFGTSDSTSKHDCLDKTEEDCLFPRRVIPLKFPAKGPVLLPWLTLSSREVHNPTAIKAETLTLSSRDVHNPTAIKAELHEKKEKLVKNEGNEASSSSSDTGATSDRERSCDVVEKSFSSSIKRSSASSEDCRKGFAPYKRRVSEREKRICSYVENTDFPTHFWPHEELL